MEKNRFLMFLLARYQEDGMVTIFLLQENRYRSIFYLNPAVVRAPKTEWQAGRPIEEAQVYTQYIIGRPAGNANAAAAAASMSECRKKLQEPGCNLCGHRNSA